MKVAIIGAGFTGLSSAVKLSQNNHQVTIFEKEKEIGGLSATFKLPGWSWALEKHYHHWFSNDQSVFRLLHELGLEKELLFPKSLTSIYYHEKIYPFNSPFHVLSFSPLSFFQRLKTGLILAYLKILPSNLAFFLEKYPAYHWLENWFGKKTYDILWKPLMDGKFSSLAKNVNMIWFWARIKKRTPRLGYLVGGYQKLLEEMGKTIKKHGGKINLGKEFTAKEASQFDKIIATVPSSEFVKIFPQLPKEYKKQLGNIPHLEALTLVLITKEKILKDTYWLNINEKNFPFIGIIQHTNLISEKYYGNQHIAYIANYLPQNHPYLKMTKEELFQIYLPYLKKINPRFDLRFTIYDLRLFSDSFAQPVFPTNYSKIKPDFTAPLPNVYLANMDMVYPWDRGTNYAIELGEKVAETVQFK